MKYDKVEYRVRPVTRYIITRYCEESDDEGRTAASNEVYGEFDNIRFANRVVVALAGQEPSRVNAQCFTLEEPEVPTRPINVSDSEESNG